eukprot:2829255-Lingulodinium_polyedra.AAC.1
MGRTLRASETGTRKTHARASRRATLKRRNARANICLCNLPEQLCRLRSTTRCVVSTLRGAMRARAHHAARARRARRIAQP